MCRLCFTLMGWQRKERYQRERESQDPITEKWCGGCVKLLPAASYFRDVSQRDGYDTFCKVCQNTRKSARDLECQERRSNQTLVVADGTERVCSQCTIRKPWAEFNKRVEIMCGIRSVCKQCCQDNQKFYRLKAKADL